jgi:hypothetical protein
MESEVLGHPHLVPDPHPPVGLSVPGVHEGASVRSHLLLKGGRLKWRRLGGGGFGQISGAEGGKEDGKAE